MVLTALVPIVVGGLALGIGRQLPTPSLLWPRIVSGVIHAPVAEEFLFRGLLVGVLSVVVGWSGPRFSLNALASAAWFASIHIKWNMESIPDAWPTLLVTGIGGLWYAWLLARWQTLWVPLFLHAGMNLGWLLGGASGGAAGGTWIDNVLRGATITIATGWTVRASRRASAPSQI